MKIFKIVILVIALIVIIVAVVLFNSVPENKEVAYPTQVQALVIAKQIVKQNLTVPSSADFIDDNLKTMDYPNDSTYVFQGVVKATNGMGLAAPAQYHIKMKWKGTKWNEQQSWDISDLSIN